ncbi:hypothetical protein BT63DRAFT_189951 [Microthyrium microscopicum]|uniref:Uncharacterized protein n=1 Tax=Microthyrium microscopicum TaxID=703497 RepID=A0A6A6UM55_9PEZI|nr:hypothetical protein BT63DRAFT_189951 [Microthyrium microscopicum]
MHAPRGMRDVSVEAAVLSCSTKGRNSPIDARKSQPACPGEQEITFWTLSPSFCIIKSILLSLSACHEYICHVVEFKINGLSVGGSFSTAQTISPNVPAAKEVSRSTNSIVTVWPEICDYFGLLGFPAIVHLAAVRCGLLEVIGLRTMRYLGSCDPIWCTVVWLERWSNIGSLIRH